MFASLVPASLRSAIRKRFMRGGTVYCPVCQTGGIAFLPSGIPPRAHAKCAFCGSLERTRLMWTLIEERGLLKSGMRVLHVAPETGLRERLMGMKGVEYIAGDKFEPGYKWASSTVQLDIRKMPFPDAHFDFVICSHVLEHVVEDRQAMAEFHRVMKPGSYGLLVVPLDLNRAVTYEDPAITTREGRLKAFGQFDHVRIYGTDYADRLRETGFAVEVVDPSEGVPYEKRFRLGLQSRKLHLVKR